MGFERVCESQQMDGISALGRPDVLTQCGVLGTRSLGELRFSSLRQGRQENLLFDGEVRRQLQVEFAPQEDAKLGPRGSTRELPADGTDQHDGVMMVRG